MMRSLYSGVSGLKTHQTKMDVIGNNIANVNTVAYKTQSITFSELMYQTTQGASGPNAVTGTGGTNAKQIGLGVKSGAISTSITSQGATQTTGNPFDLKITGNAFFVVSSGKDNYFTRDGSFYVDAAGNLAMSSNGYNVMGWQVNEETMSIKKDTVSALRIMSAENMTYPPEATTRAYVSGIIDKNDAQVATEDGKIMNLGFFDSLGYAYTAKLSMKSTDTEGQYSVELKDILDSNGQSVMSKYDDITLGSPIDVARTQTLALNAGYTFDGTNLNYVDTATGTTGTFPLNATLLTDDAGGLTSVQKLGKLANAYGFDTYADFARQIYTDSIAVPPTTTTMGELVTAGTIIQTAGVGPGIAADGTLTVTGERTTGGLVQYDTATGIIRSVNNSTANLNLSLDFGDDTLPAGPFNTIKVDFSTSSNFNNNGTSTISATNGDLDGLGTGRKLGELSGVSIQNNGMIYASYDNGQTKLLGQIAVAEFANASGLSKEGDNLYAATMNSGEFDGIGTDITAGGGYLSTGVLEMSNVDLSAEFTEMITTQRGFQANSRIITVSDTLLEELVNLKR